MAAMMRNLQEVNARENLSRAILLKPSRPVSILRVSGKQQCLATECKQRNQARVVNSFVQGERQPVQRIAGHIVLNSLSLGLGQSQILQLGRLRFDRPLT